MVSFVRHLRQCPRFEWYSCQYSLVCWAYFLIVLTAQYSSYPLGPRRLSQLDFLPSSSIFISTDSAFLWPLQLYYHTSTFVSFQFTCLLLILLFTLWICWFPVSAVVFVFARWIVTTFLFTDLWMLLLRLVFMPMQVLCYEITFYRCSKHGTNSWYYCLFCMIVLRLSFLTGLARWEGFWLRYSSTGTL